MAIFSLETQLMKKDNIILSPMKLDLKYDINLCCKMVLQEQLDKMQSSYTITGLSEIEIKGKFLMLRTKSWKQT